MRIYKCCYLLLGLWLLALSTSAAAQLKVDILEGVEGGIPVAVIPFSNEDQDSKRNYSSIIASDLAYSGLFSLVNPSVFAALGLPESSSSTYAIWNEKGIEKIVGGEVVRHPKQGDMVIVSLFDVVVKKKIATWRIPINGASVPSIAHRMSDLIYKELTGVDGIFSTSLVLVSSKKTDLRKRRYYLNIADADGYNVTNIFNSDSLLVSPVWLPDRKRIAYVSYENDQPEVIIQVLESGQRESLLAQIGSANMIDWSYDGKKIAYVSSKDGNPEIYIYDFPSNRSVRVTHNLAIDTEPSWAPNNTLYFTSDRSGNPQIYMTERGGKEPQRVTFEGSYNSDVDVSPRGDRIAYLSVRNGQFAIVVRDLSNDQEMELSFGSLEERPRFAPNGQLLSYLTYDAKGSALGLVTVDGVFGKRVPIDAPYVRAISWSPLHTDR